MGAAFMHVVVAVLYAVVLWVSAVAYEVVVGGPVFGVVMLAPVVISGVAAVAMCLGFVFVWSSYVAKFFVFTAQRWRNPRWLLNG